MIHRASQSSRVRFGKAAFLSEATSERMNEPLYARLLLVFRVSPTTGTTLLVNKDARKFYLRANTPRRPRCVQNPRPRPSPAVAASPIGVMHSRPRESIYALSRFLYAARRFPGRRTRKIETEREREKETETERERNTVYPSLREQCDVNVFVRTLERTFRSSHLVWPVSGTNHFCVPSKSMLFVRSTGWLECLRDDRTIISG